MFLLTYHTTWCHYFWHVIMSCWMLLMAGVQHTSPRRHRVKTLRSLPFFPVDPNVSWQKEATASAASSVALHVVGFCFGCNYFSDTLLSQEVNGLFWSGIIMHLHKKRSFLHLGQLVRSSPPSAGNLSCNFRKSPKCKQTQRLQAEAELQSLHNHTSNTTEELSEQLFTEAAFEHTA